ncbi:hypothetical protein [Chitinophaga sp. S165]|uniref:hypothetical protein n=1 Tax=Chitinophaga sp. S165 TaxID=2135462 RepID=UPI000D8EB63F|nr:hypothetical protein [Chitinophaga sp. S165]PWV45821.1 hypothetical protein C7475_11238 [Chitinophaga sp. S165]
MIRNLLVEIPEVPGLMLRARNKWNTIASPLLKYLNRSGVRNPPIPVVDLDVLRNILAARLPKNHRKLINISDSLNIDFEQVRLKDILADQASILQKMIQQQRRILDEQTEKFIQEEKKRREKHHSTSRHS